MKTELNINDIAKTVALVQKVNCQGTVLISEVAHEMGVKKTALMQYIEDHPLLFILLEVKDSRGSVKGLGIRTVYTEEVQNPKSDAWLEMKRKEWEKKIKISEFLYYDKREFLYIPVDQEDTQYDSQRYHLWRNTPEKIAQLEKAGLIKKGSTCYGGIGDCFKWTGYLATLEVRGALDAAGWELEMPTT